MSKRFYFSESIVGVANAEVLGIGITSTEGEVKVLKAVSVVTSARQGNEIRLWREREKILALNDNLAILPADHYREKLEVDHEIPVGQTIKGAVNCGGTLTTIHVLYEYEIEGS